MSTTTKALNRAATALVATAFVLTAGAGIASAQLPTDSFNADVGSGAVGPLTIPGLGANLTGVYIGDFRVPVPLLTPEEKPSGGTFN